MTSATLLFPHQLYWPNPALAKDREAWLVEDELFFGQVDFHPLKRILHRASMKAYQARLEDNGYTVRYIEHAAHVSLSELLQTPSVDEWHVADPNDYLLEKRLDQSGKKWRRYPSPGFLLERETAVQDLQAKDRYHQTDFYMRQRRRHQILLDANGKPTGGQWTFDGQNRKKLPKGIEPPPPWMPDDNAFVTEARQYVAANYGQSTSGSFPWPVTHADAERVLLDFVQNRLHAFGDYQDALDPERPFLYHALLTPALNCGLLTPRQIVDAVLDRHADEPVPLNALEGFLRQIIGWREYLRGIYLLEGVTQRNGNFWGFEAGLPPAFARGETGFPPVDDALRKVKRFAYAHHIERLMVLGNVLLLAEVHPDAAYRWFMAQFIDAYDWVMVPNVYGMSQYADGGLITTKPYLSGSNYIRKQSHYPKGDWCAEWDALFWRFIWTNHAVFLANPRMAMMARLAEKMDPGKRQAHLDLGEAVLARWRE